MDQVTTALFSASRQGNVPVLKEIFGLINHLDVKDDRGYTPLIIAAYNSQYEAVKALLYAGADSNAADNSGNTALMGACFKGYADIAQLLITNGADVNAVHSNGGTALMFAVMFGRNDIIKTLIDNGADVTLKDNRGLDVVDIAFQQGNKAALDILQKIKAA